MADRFVVREDGTVEGPSGPIDLADVAAQLPWVDALFDPDGGGMPRHQYVVFDGDGVRREMTDPTMRLRADVLWFAIKHHPGSYDAYFRGYRYPMRYLELDDKYRYWRTALGKTHTLNHCTLDSVEPPRRVDQGAKPMHLEWDGPPWGKSGSAWPVGYHSDGKGGYIHDIEADWKMRYRCARCGRRFMPIPDDRPCPRCGHRMADDKVGSR